VATINEPKVGRALDHTHNGWTIMLNLAITTVEGGPRRATHELRRVRNDACLLSTAYLAQNMYSIVNYIRLLDMQADGIL
jgi:hypothetical protein